MAHFSRLTDIVECNLTTLLDGSENPQELLSDIIQEMQEGLSGARRSMETAKNNQVRLRQELEENETKVAYWQDKARESLQANDEDQARLALVRKREHEDLLASLEHSLKAATETVEHLAKTYRALSARLAESQRRAQVLASGGSLEADEPTSVNVDAASTDEIEDELAALKRELGQA